MIDATTFADVETALVTATDPYLSDAVVSNKTPPKITGKVVTYGFSGGGSRAWGEAAVNAGVNVYAQTDAACRALALRTQDVLAAISDDLIQSVRVPAGGGTVIPAQTPPFQRYFVVTVYLRGQALVDLDLS